MKKQTFFKQDNYKLVFPNLTKKDINDLSEYCSVLGYQLEIDDEKKKAVISNEAKMRHGFIQKIRGVLWYVYGRKRENLTLNINFMKSYIRSMGIPDKNDTIEFMFGIVDFKHINF